MFLKNANFSLVQKLIFLYVVSMLGILLAAAFFLYPTFVMLMSHVDVHSVQIMLVRCYTNFIIAFLGTAVFALIAGTFITKKSLKKIDDFAGQLKGISVGSLHERVIVSDWPSELHSLGNQFNDMLDRLEHSFKQLSAFSMDIAHELRTPINQLKVSTEVVLLHSETGGAVRDLLEEHLEEYTELTKLIENLLFLARSEHGQVNLTLSEIDVHGEIDQMIDYYQPLLDEKSISVTCSGNVKIKADVVLFKRVISNLLSNAIRYTPPSGQIHWELSTTEAGKIMISISDNGIGISEEHLTHIFKRFYRANDEVKSGTGLGLAIAQAIVHLHGGIITIHSNVNQGTRVEVVFNFD